MNNYSELNKYNHALIIIVVIITVRFLMESGHLVASLL